MWDVIFFAFGAMISWAVGDFLIQRSTRKVGDANTLLVIGFIGSAMLLPFVWKELYLLTSGPYLQFLLLLSIVNVVVSLINFEALKSGKLSVIEVLLEIELPVTIGLGIIFFSETLTITQVVLIILLFVGMVMLAMKEYPIKIEKLEHGFWLAVLTALGYGVVNFLVKKGAVDGSPLLTIWVSWTMITVVCLALVISRNGIGSLQQAARKHSTLFISMGILDTLAWVFYAFAVRDSSLSITTAITESYPALALVLGLWINKESVKKHQLVGAAIMLTSSILIGLTTTL